MALSEIQKIHKGSRVAMWLANKSSKIAMWWIANKLVNEISVVVDGAFLDVFGEASRIPHAINVDISDEIPEGKIAGYNHKEDTIVISSKAFDDVAMLDTIVKHELIHAAIGMDNDFPDSHGVKFRKMAEYLKIPKKFQD